MVELQLHPIPYPPELLGPRSRISNSRGSVSGHRDEFAHPLMNLAFWVLKSATTSFRAEGRRDSLHPSELRQP